MHRKDVFMYIVDSTGQDFHYVDYFDKEENAFDYVERMKRIYRGNYIHLRVFSVLLEVKVNESKR